MEAQADSVRHPMGSRAHGPPAEAAEPCRGAGEDVPTTSRRRRRPRHGVPHHRAEDGAAQRDDPGRTLTAAYPDGAPTWMDYPFTILGSATRLNGTPRRGCPPRCRSPMVRRRWPRADSAPRTGRRADRPADGRTVASSPHPAVAESATDAVLQRWAAVTRSGGSRFDRRLGSMNAVVPGQRKTRLAVTMDAAVRGLKMFEPTTTLGLWTFASRLDGDRRLPADRPGHPGAAAGSGPARDAPVDPGHTPRPHRAVRLGAGGVRAGPAELGARQAERRGRLTDGTTTTPGASARRPAPRVCAPRPIRVAR